MLTTTTSGCFDPANMRRNNFIALFVFFFCALLPAQQASIYQQNFKGVKSVKFYFSCEDSLGKITKPKTLYSEQFFDSTGAATRILFYVNGVLIRSINTIYDSLGRVTLDFEWSLEEGNRKFVYSYATDSSGVFELVTVKENDAVMEAQSNYWDENTHLHIMRTWGNTDMMGYGPPSLEEGYNKDGKLVMQTSSLGSTEYRYDEYGNMNRKLYRPFEDG